MNPTLWRSGDSPHSVPAAEFGNQFRQQRVLYQMLSDP